MIEEWPTGRRYSWRAFSFSHRLVHGGQGAPGDACALNVVITAWRFRKEVWFKAAPVPARPETPRPG